MAYNINDLEKNFRLRFLIIDVVLNIGFDDVGGASEKLFLRI
jgi:hypothetical protein